MTQSFSSTLTVCDIHFCIWNLSKFISIRFPSGPLWSVKCLNFGGESCEIRILSRSIQETYTLRKVKKKGFTFSIQLRNKFVWSHGLRCLTGFWIRFCIARKHLIKIVWHYIIIFPFQLYLSFIASCSQEKGYLLIYLLTY